MCKNFKRNVHEHYESNNMPFAGRLALAEGTMYLMAYRVHKWTPSGEYD